MFGFPIIMTGTQQISNRPFLIYTLGVGGYLNKMYLDDYSTEILSSTINAVDPYISPDNKWVVYAIGSGTNDGLQLWKYNLQTNSNSLLLTGTNIKNPHISDDNTKLVYSSGTSTGIKIYDWDTNTGAISNLVTKNPTLYMNDVIFDENSTNIVYGITVSNNHLISYNISTNTQYNDTGLYWQDPTPKIGGYIYGWQNQSPFELQINNGGTTNTVGTSLTGSVTSPVLDRKNNKIYFFETGSGTAKLRIRNLGTGVDNGNILTSISTSETFNLLAAPNFNLF